MPKKHLAPTLLAAVVSLNAADHPQAKISNGQIRATLYLPDAQKGYYRGTRFDWSGIVAGLEYKGHNYYGPWYGKTDPTVHDFVYRDGEIVAGPCSAIPGPVEEFSPVGYEEAKAGGTFLKFGIGLLRKPDDAPYDHYKLYEIADPGKWTVRTGKNWVELTQEVGGFTYKKTVRLAEGKPVMTLEHSLKNTGRNAIETNVYNHNFLVLDHQPPGPDFTIAFPFELRANRSGDAKLAEVRGKQVVYLKALSGEETYSTALQGFGDSPADYEIRVDNAKIGAGLRITGDRPLSRVYLWSIRSVLSIEPYLAIKVEPGGEFTWNLTYEFHTVPQRGR